MSSQGLRWRVLKDSRTHNILTLQDSQNLEDKLIPRLDAVTPIESLGSSKAVVETHALRGKEERDL